MEINVEMGSIKADGDVDTVENTNTEENKNDDTECDGVMLSLNSTIRSTGDNL